LPTPLAVKVAQNWMSKWNGTTEYSVFHATWATNKWVHTTDDKGKDVLAHKDNSDLLLRHAVVNIPLAIHKGDQAKVDHVAKIAKQLAVQGFTQIERDAVGDTFQQQGHTQRHDNQNLARMQSDCTFLIGTEPLRLPRPVAQSGITVHSAIISITVRLPVMYAPNSPSFALPMPHAALCSFLKHRGEATPGEETSCFQYKGRMWECAIWISEDTPLTDPAHWPQVLIKDTNASSKLGSSARRLRWLPPKSPDGLATVSSAKATSWITAFKETFWLAMKNRAIRDGAGWQWIDNQDWRSGAYKRVATQGHGDKAGGRPTKQSKAGWQPSNAWKESRKLSPLRENDVPHKDQKRDSQTSAGSSTGRAAPPPPPPPPDKYVPPHSGSRAAHQPPDRPEGTKPVDWTPQLSPTWGRDATWGTTQWRNNSAGTGHNAEDASHTRERWDSQQWVDHNTSDTLPTEHGWHDAQWRS